MNHFLQIQAHFPSQHESTVLYVKYSTKKYSRTLSSQSTLLMLCIWNKELQFNGTGARTKVFYFSN